MKYIPAQKITCTRSELPDFARALLSRFDRELHDFDRRPAKYRPKQELTPVGAVLLISEYDIADEDRHGCAE